MVRVIVIFRGVLSSDNRREMKEKIQKKSLMHGICIRLCSDRLRPLEVVVFSERFYAFNSNMARAILLG